MSEKSRREQRSTITVSTQARKRLKSLKPYESVSYEELLMEMADLYESHTA